MKKITCILLLLLPFTLFGQSETGILFETGSWSEIVAKSKATGKPIFIDCYTSWCGPCKHMADKVFTDPKVAAYYNATFICAKFDMEKGEGIDLKKKFDVSVYPTFLYVDGDENMLNRLVGGMDATKFVEKAKAGLADKRLFVFQQRFNGGERSDEFIIEYITLLTDVYMNNEAETILVSFLEENNNMERLKEKKIWDLFAKCIKNVDTKPFKYVHDNRKEFQTLYTEKALNDKLFSVWYNNAIKYVKKNEEGKYVFDEKGYKKCVSLMKKEKVDFQKSIEQMANIYYAGKMENWNAYVSGVESRIKQDNGVPVSIAALVDYGKVIANKCEDEKLKQKSIPWFEDALTRLQARAKEAKDPKDGVQKTLTSSFAIAMFESDLKEIIKKLKGE